MLNRLVLLVGGVIRVRAYDAFFVKPNDEILSLRSAKQRVAVVTIRPGSVLIIQASSPRRTEHLLNLVLSCFAGPDIRKLIRWKGFPHGETRTKRQAKRSQKDRSNEWMSFLFHCAPFSICEAVGRYEFDLGDGTKDRRAQSERMVKTARSADVRFFQHPGQLTPPLRSYLPLSKTSKQWRRKG